MRLVLASHNENKLRELRAALPDWTIELLDAPVVVALGLSSVLLIGAMTQVVFYGPQKQYEDCMTGANTTTAQASCNQQRQRNILGSLTEF